MDIRLELVGRSPLLMHNIALADPDNEVVKEIATYTAKGSKMTKDDRKAISRLEWFAGLYIENGRVVMPTANIRKALINAGKASKQGTQIARALSFHDLNVPLTYPDAQLDLETLYKDTAYINRAAVGISGKRPMRVRPQFNEWAVVADAFLLDDVMDAEDLRRIARRAGLAEGLCDNRINGYGRFDVKVIVS